MQKNDKTGGATPSIQDECSSKAFNIASSSAIEVLKVLVSLCLQVIIAWSFGAGKDMDAYFTAYAISYFFYRMGAGISGYMLIPLMSDYMVKEKKMGHAHISSVFNWILFSMITLGLAGFCTRNQLVELVVPGFSPVSKEITASLLGILIWLTVLGAIVDIGAAIMKYHHNFIIPAAAPLVQFAIMISTVILFSKSIGIHSLAIGLVAGFIGQAAFQLIMMRKHEFRYKFSFSLPPGETAKIIRIAVPLVISAMALSSIDIADKFFASHLDEGSVSYLGYAYRILSIVLLASSVVSTVYFTTLSRLAGEKRKEEVVLHFNRATRIILFVAIPALACLSVFGVEIIRLFLQKGNFTPEATNMIAVIFFFYMPAIAIWSIWSLCCSVFYAFLKTYIPVLCFITIAVFNVFFNWLFVGYFGVYGIALATSVAYSLGMGLMAYFIIRNFGTGSFVGIPSIIIPLIFSGAVSFLSSRILFNVLWKMHFPDNRIIYFIYLAISISAGILLFLGMAKIFKIREATEIKERILNPFLSRFASN